MTDWTVGHARSKGLGVDEKAFAERVKMLKAVYPPEPLLERIDAAGAMEQLAYPLVGLAANGYRPIDLQTAWRRISRRRNRQTDRGMWGRRRGLPPRKATSSARRFACGL